MKKVFSLPKFLGILAVVLTALLAVGSVFATGLITVNNGNFVDSTGWVWVAAGYDSGVTRTLDGSGSANLVVDSTGAASIFQCVNVSTSITNTHISIRGYVIGTGTASIGLYAFSDCLLATLAGIPSSTATSNSVTAGPSWQEASTTLATSALTVPTGGSVLIVLTVSGNLNDTAWFDDVEAYPSGPNAVTLRDFSAQAQPPTVWLWPVAVLIVLGGAWVMLRRRA